MMYRAVSTLTVADPRRWSELSAGGLSPSWLGEPLSETTRVIADAKAVLSHLEGRALVRYARRPPEQVAADQEAMEAAVARLPPAARRVLHNAQRHALDHQVVGLHAWDPESDAQSVRILHGAGLIRLRSTRETPLTGRYNLAPDLPPAPAIAYDMSEAVMPEEEDDLSPARPGLIPLMHDMASLAAAILQTRPRRTHRGPLMKVDARRLGNRLGDPAIVAHSSLSQTPRWGLALRALEALKAVRADPLTRAMDVDLGLEMTLSGPTPQAVDRLAHRMVDRDQHVLLPAIRAALRQAGPGCVDTIVFCDLLREQHRAVLFPPWRRGPDMTYPHLDGEAVLPYNDDSFEQVEVPVIERLLRRLDLLGLVRRADGIFAATADGRIWSGAARPPVALLWIGSDLELIVPPESVTPWERFQLERMSRCVMRDVVDRYVLDQEGLSAWLSGHDLSEAIDLLRRRSPGVPLLVEETLRGWERAALQVVITHGVLLAEQPVTAEQ